MSNYKNRVVEKAREILLEISRETPLQDKRILIGLSGGADSVSLLLSLIELSEEFSFSLVCCHVNHMIRGKEADRDESFTRELCKKYRIEFYSTKIDIPALAKERKQSLELCARQQRYSYFESFIASGKADFVATAHTRSDNAETVLFNIARGTGLAGLCGIPTVRGNIIRPLINVQRYEIEEYLKEANQEFVTDSTNLSCEYARNIIRHKVVPALSKVNESVVSNISDMSKIAFRENAFLERLVCDMYTDNLEQLSRLDEVIRCRIIGKMYRDFCSVPLEYRHIEILNCEIVKYCEQKIKKNKVYNLPNKVSAILCNGRLSFKNTNEKDKCDKSCIFPEQALNYGENLIFDGLYLAIVTDTENEAFEDVIEKNKNVYTLFIEAVLFTDIINGKLSARQRRAGDKIVMCGMTKSIKKLLCDKKVPQEERLFLPVISDEKEILFVPYIGLCDNHRQYNKNLDKIHIKIYKANKELEITNEKQK